MRRGAFVGVLCACALVGAVPAQAAGPALGFAPAQFLDDELAGGEPIVFADVAHGTLIYSAHEGTTHLYRPGLASSAPVSWLANYRNQVNIWISSDNGTTWKRVINNQFNGADPSKDQGFSDPDLTQDEGGRVYDTGIDLANDSLFSSADGGRTWDKGTPQCHDGDRPWLSGARKDEVFLATNTNANGHQIFQSTDGGNTCSQTGFPDPNGNGKMLYDRSRDALVEPVTPSNSLGVGVWERSTQKFTQHIPVHNIPGGMYAHWPAIALDDAGGLYMVWDDDPRQPNTTTGCNSSQKPAPNHISMIYSPDLGKTWAQPITIAAPPSSRVLWPWVTAGDPGKANVV